MVRIAHQIRFKPNKGRVTYFAGAAGIARFVCNWVLAEWGERGLEAGSHLDQTLANVAAARFERYQKGGVSLDDGSEQERAQIAIVQLGTAFQNFFVGWAR